jgi:hypothetical protein
VNSGKFWEIYFSAFKMVDPVSTAERLLLYANNLKKIFLELPLSILKTAIMTIMVP